MRSRPVLCMFLLAFVVATEVSAGWYNLTRSRCRTLLKRYISYVEVGCKFNPLPLCKSYSSNCNGTTAACGAKACSVGGCSSITASNGPNGGSHSGGCTGNGVAGVDQAGGTEDRSASETNRVKTKVEFDEKRRRVTITLDEGDFAVSGANAFTALEVSVWLGGDNGGETARPRRGTMLWQGRMRLTERGATYAGGLSARDFSNVSRERGGATRLRMLHVVKVIEIPRGHFDQAAVFIAGDNGTPAMK